MPHSRCVPNRPMMLSPSRLDDALLAQSDRLIQPAGHLHQPHRFARPRPMSSAMASSSAIASDAQVLEAFLDRPDARADPRVLSACPSISRAPRSWAIERLPRPARPTREAATEHQHLRIAGHGPGPRLGGRLCRDQPYRGAIGFEGEPALRGDPGISPEPLVEEARTDRVDRVDQRIAPGYGPRHERLVESRDAGELREQLHTVDTGPVLRVWDMVPQLDRALVLGPPRGTRTGPRPLARDDGGREGARQLMGRVPVIGELGLRACHPPGSRRVSGRKPHAAGSARRAAGRRRSPPGAARDGGVLFSPAGEDKISLGRDQLYCSGLAGPKAPPNPHYVKTNDYSIN